MGTESLWRLKHRVFIKCLVQDLACYKCSASDIYYKVIITVISHCACIYLPDFMYTQTKNRETKNKRMRRVWLMFSIPFTVCPCVQRPETWTYCYSELCAQILMDKVVDACILHCTSSLRDLQEIFWLYIAILTLDVNFHITVESTSLLCC